MPYPVIADPALELRDALGLPTFEIAGMTLYKRLALVAERGSVVKVVLPGLPARPERRRSRRVAARAMNLDHVAEALDGEPTYRVRQVWEWAARGASSYDEMTNLPTADARAARRPGAVLDADARRTRHGEATGP